MKMNLSKVKSILLNIIESTICPFCRGKTFEIQMRESYAKSRECVDCKFNVAVYSHFASIGYGDYKVFFMEEKIIILPNVSISEIIAKSYDKSPFAEIAFEDFDYELSTIKEFCSKINQLMIFM